MVMPMNRSLPRATFHGAYGSSPSSAHTSRARARCAGLIGSIPRPNENGNLRGFGR
jgi:hypothetical protein